MRPGLLLVVWVACLAACRERPAKAPAPDGGSARATVPAPPPVDGGYVVDPDKLDRFIRYQRRTLASSAQMLEALAREEGSGLDGGMPSPEAVAELRRLASGQERLREELGLTEEDVRVLEDLVGEVISRRADVAGPEEAESIRQMKALAETLPEEQRADFEAAIASIEQQREALHSLDDVRRRFGSENVDRVLAREADLTRNWNDAIAAFAGTAPRRRSAPEAGGLSADAGQGSVTPLDAGDPQNAGTPDAGR
ncbi:MAG: hypothetical protein IRZ16_12790 [Myxococcaceae bacterium]|nr:hypothetical protein [Myxococcaceae bacterium]